MQVIAGREEDGSFTVHSPSSTVTGLDEAGFARSARELEASLEPRWVFPSAESTYPVLVAAGVRVRRCYDVALAEGLLLAYEGAEEQSRSLRAAWARANGEEPPPDSAAVESAQPTLFETRVPTLPEGVTVVTAVRRVLAEQERRVAATEHPDRMRLLLAA
ncbi:bifunctional 3'-5' exonuclease/DNA polymerase, partial [Amycolatopsis sp. SID8362]|nr:bifunctional 3'-5' exonuclease/DNA polymerase [Amycolatopsis sp. SID8362]NED45388.1 bifunctional 3'-5' exonuclease/DNA polymerase [Amycolatopsis sp. SID8362]